MQVHEDLTQQQNNAAHSIFKIRLDDGQDFYIFRNLVWASASKRANGFQRTVNTVMTTLSAPS